MSISKTEGLVALAANVDRNRYPHDAVDLNLLEAAPVPNMGRLLGPSVVFLDCPEFTSLCPLTGQADFGHLKIYYQPAAHIIESKSLKLYLGSFRNSGEFHEACVMMIRTHLVDLARPEWLVVKGVIRPRGGIAITPSASVGKVPDWVMLRD